jgi:hypothetical protein
MVAAVVAAEHFTIVLVPIIMVLAVLVLLAASMFVI